MSQHLTVGSVVSIHINDGMTRIGKIECIIYNSNTCSFMHVFDTTDIGYINKINYVGINLVDPLCNGGDGSIGDIQYFNAPLGHGIFIRSSSIIREVSSAELMAQLQQASIAMRKEYAQYSQLLADRDAYIQQLIKEKRKLKRRIKKKNSRSGLCGSLMCK